MAERQGFEPWVPFRVHTLSKRAPSATRPSLRSASAGQGIPAKPTPFIVAYRAPCRGSGSGRAQTLKGCLLFFLQLLRQVVLVSHFADRVQLSFQPVDVVLFVGEDLLRQFARPSIVGCQAQLDAVVEPFDRVVLQLQVVLVLLLNGLANVDLE